MAAKLKLESVSSRQARPQTRRVARLFARSRMTVRSSNGERSKANIHDVSVFGCAIDCDASWLRNGMFVSLVLSPEWSIQAVVRWVRNGRAGIEFLRPISETDAIDIAGQ